MPSEELGGSVFDFIIVLVIWLIIAITVFASAVFAYFFAVGVIQDIKQGRGLEALKFGGLIIMAIVVMFGAVLLYAFSPL